MTKARHVRAAASSPGSMSAPPRCAASSRASAMRAIRRSSASATRSPRPARAAPSSTWRRPSAPILTTVHAAEQMAGETIRDVVVNVSGGHPASQTIAVDVDIAGHEVGDADLRRALDHGQRIERRRRPPPHPLDPRRLHHRRQPRHPRSPRHVWRAPRRRHACDHRRRRAGCATCRPASSAAISTSSSLVDRALRRRPGDAWSRTRSISASPSSTWAAAPPPSPSSSTAM